MPLTVEDRTKQPLSPCAIRSLHKYFIESLDATPRSFSVVIKGTKKESVGRDCSLKVSGNRKESIGGNQSLTVGGDQQEKVGQKHALDAGQEIHLKSGMKIIIEAGMQISLKGPGGFVDIGPEGVTIQGTMVMRVSIIS